MNYLDMTTAINPYESGDKINRAMSEYELTMECGSLIIAGDKRPLCEVSTSGPYLRDGQVCVMLSPEPGPVDVTFSFDVPKDGTDGIAEEGK